jgi:hypothetical protein
LTSVVGIGTWNAIGGGAFSGCTSLNHLGFNSWDGSISSIDSSAFNNCATTGTISGTHSQELATLMNGLIAGGTWSGDTA